MTIEEILHASQTLTFEERKKLIHGLFAQMPQTGGLAGTIEYVGDWEEAKRSLRTLVNESLEKTALEFAADSEEVKENAECQST